MSEGQKIARDGFLAYLVPPCFKRNYIECGERGHRSLFRISNNPRNMLCPDDE